MVLDLEVEAEGFALHIHVDRTPAEVLAGVMGCYNAIAGQMDQFTDLRARCCVENERIAGDTTMAVITEAIKVIHARLDPGAQVALFLQDLLRAHGFDRQDQEGS